MKALITVASMKSIAFQLGVGNKHKVNTNPKKDIERYKNISSSKFTNLHPRFGWLYCFLFFLSSSWSVFTILPRMFVWHSSVFEHDCERNLEQFFSSYWECFARVYSFLLFIKQRHSCIENLWIQRMTKVVY